jgi:hypothetical protein
MYQPDNIKFKSLYYFLAYRAARTIREGFEEAKRRQRGESG